MSRHNRPCLLCKVTTWVKVKPAIFGLGAHAHKASLEVNGLEEPPAGSGREGGGGGNGPSWKETVDLGESQPLSHGTLCNHRAALLPGSSLSGHGGFSPGRFQHPLLGGTFLRTMCASPASIPTGSWTIFKAYAVVIKKEVVGSQTRDKSQLSATEPKLQAPLKRQ